MSQNTDTLRTTLYDATGLQLYLETPPSSAEPPQLHLSDGGSSVKIGTPAAASALAEVLRSIASD